MNEITIQVSEQDLKDILMCISHYVDDMVGVADEEDISRISELSLKLEEYI